MAKNPNRKPKPAKKGDSMNGAMNFFLAGCIAELYLMLIRRYYVNGAISQVLAWDSYLVVLGWAGVAVLAVGVVLSILWKGSKKKRVIGWTVAGAGAFLAAASFLVHWNMSVLTLLMVVVPVSMLLCILWCLYDRECALALTILAVSLVAVWVCRRIAGGPSAAFVKALVVLYMLLLLAVVGLAKGKKLTRLLPAKADLLPVYVACGLSLVALAAALLSSGIAYYAMWALAAVVFALAVYYTVKQL